MPEQVCNLIRNGTSAIYIMPSLRISKDNNHGIYFTTFTTVHWYYLFDRYNRWKIIADSLCYCISHKNLKLYGFVFMLNHIHIIFESEDSAGFLRDFKKFTSKKLKENIVQTEPHILKLFKLDEEYHFWQKTNMPLLIETEKFMLQKLQYIHNNPVSKGYVLRPQYWYWSSANLECELKAISF